MSDLDREQLRNAAIIYQVGRQLGASGRDIQIALITALTESQLRNVNYGDRDSLGLFQQRAPWGTAEERMDPWTSAKMFFLGGSKADGYSEPGLFSLKNRGEMGMGEAAQAVQRSAFPDRYATFLPLVQNVWPKVQRAGGAEVTDMDGRQYGAGDAAQPDVEPEVPGPVDPSLGAPEYRALGAPEFAALRSAGPSVLGAPTQNAFGANAAAGSILSPETNRQLNQILGEKGKVGKGIDGWRGKVVDLAREYIGTPYVWGGTSPDGFDCSGLPQYVYGKLGFELPRISYQQANFGERVGLNKLRPGDLVAWDNSSRNNGADHIAIYIGNGQILEAPRPGLSVRIRDLGKGEGAWGVKLDF